MGSDGFCAGLSEVTFASSEEEHRLSHGVHEARPNGMDVVGNTD
jgi:hypothetical protein